MSSGLIVLLEILLVLGVAVGFGVRELLALRRFDRDRAARAKAEAEREQP
ncbi:hypothetical protein FHS85_004595 [Rhodoligotrophos appendicifer]|nr:hypothetical protein [Rhodoligotrophos appendicifer]